MATVTADEFAQDAALERRTMRKVMLRLLPMMGCMYLVNNLDRVNISFAALTMNADIGLTPLTYAWGAGIFFIAYFLFEVPSNLVMERVGARLWMTRIMISWGLISAATAFITGPTSFMIIRFLLGAAEAGLFPGMVLYITYWFPPRYRARAMGLFLLSAPLSFMLAGLLSVPLLRMDGLLGLHGWQWMFIIEALPTLVLAWVVYTAMPDTPREARWLTAEEAGWLERQCRRPTGHVGIIAELAAIMNPKVALLASIYITRCTAMYGVSLFLPLIVKEMGLTNEQTGFASAVPFACATVASFLWAYSSDRKGERHWHTIASVALACLGLAIAGYIGASTLALVGITLAAIGVYSQPSCFWALPPAILTGATAAAGIALINATGNLGGFVGPYLVGWTQEATGAYSYGLYLLAGFAGVSALLGVLLSRLGWDKGGGIDAAPGRS